MPKTHPHWTEHKQKAEGGGGGPQDPGERMHKPLGERDLDDVMFSLHKCPARARRYELGGEHTRRDLEIERQVEDRLLTEYIRLGGPMISLEEARRRTA